MNELIKYIKEKIYAKDEDGLPTEEAFEANNVLYEYDYQRARNEVERENAWKAWKYRFEKIRV